MPREGIEVKDEHIQNAYEWLAENIATVRILMRNYSNNPDDLWEVVHEQAPAIYARWDTVRPLKPFMLSSLRLYFLKQQTQRKPLELKNEIYFHDVATTSIGAPLLERIGASHKWALDQRYIFGRTIREMADLQGVSHKEMKLRIVEAEQAFRRAHDIERTNDDSD